MSESHSLTSKSFNVNISELIVHSVEVVHKCLVPNLHLLQLILLKKKCDHQHGGVVEVRCTIGII